MIESAESAPRRKPDGSAHAATGESPGGVVRERAGELWDEAKHGARDKLDQQRHTAADGLGDVAAALRDAAERRRRDGDDGFARLTATAADGLDRLSGTLHDKDLGAMLRDVDAFARRQPAAFFGLAVVAGFAAVRLLKPDH